MSMSKPFTRAVLLGCLSAVVLASHGCGDAGTVSSIGLESGDTGVEERPSGDEVTVDDPAPHDVSLPEPSTMAAPETGGTEEPVPPPPDHRLDLSAGCEEQPVAYPIESSPGQLPSGAEYLYVIPQNAHSLMFVFHGGGGSKEDSLENRIEGVLIAREAIERGYAIISLDSLQHINDEARDLKWNDNEPDENPDVENVSALIHLFREELQLVPSEAPVIAMGFSNGGSMASRVAQLEVVDAAVIYISNAQYFNEPGARIPPTVFLPGAQDPGHALASNTAYLESIEANGGNAELFVNSPEPATPGIFTRIPGVDCETSIDIIRGLMDGDWMDELGTVLRDPNAELGWSNYLPMEFRTILQKQQVKDVLVELYAGHSPSAQWNIEVFDFLQEHTTR